MPLAVLRSVWGVLLRYFVGCPSIWVCLMCPSWFQVWRGSPSLYLLRSALGVAGAGEKHLPPRASQNTSRPWPRASAAQRSPSLSSLGGVASWLYRCVSVASPLVHTRHLLKSWGLCRDHFPGLDLLVAGLGHEFIFRSISCKLAADSEAASDLSWALGRDLK